jgi:hypothetical protein
VILYGRLEYTKLFLAVSLSVDQLFKKHWEELLEKVSRGLACNMDI